LALVVASHTLEQPERDMRRPHRLLDGAHQVLAQLAQVHLAPQRCRKFGQGAGRIVFGAIEAAVDEGLNAAA
jgi:hypothetical protein